MSKSKDRKKRVAAKRLGQKKCRLRKREGSSPVETIPQIETIPQKREDGPPVATPLFCILCAKSSAVVVHEGPNGPVYLCQRCKDQPRDYLNKRLRRLPSTETEQPVPTDDNRCQPITGPTDDNRCQPMTTDVKGGVRISRSLLLQEESGNSDASETQPTPTVLSFGKHKGKPLREIENNYLLWVLRRAEHVRQDERDAVKEELKARGVYAEPVGASDEQPAAKSEPSPTDQQRADRVDASPRHDPSQLLSAKDLARMLQVSKRTICRMVRGGRLPKPLSLGKQVVRWDRRVLPFRRENQ